MNDSLVKKGMPKRLLAILLCVVMCAGLMPADALAAVGEGETVVAVAAPETAAYTVASGTALSDVGLPAALTATVSTPAAQEGEEAATREESLAVAWQGEYDAAVAGEYSLTATFTDSAALADGVVMPGVTVTVTAAEAEAEAVFAAVRLNLDAEAVTNDIGLVPAFYTPADMDAGKTAALFSFEDKQHGATVYRVYGAYGEEAPAFFASDMYGSPLERYSSVTEADDLALNTASVVDATDVSAEEPVAGKPVAEEPLANALGAQDAVTAVAAPEQTAYTVKNGTALADAGLPTALTATVSTPSETEGGEPTTREEQLPVTWEGDYAATTAGDYVLTAKLADGVTTGEGVVMPTVTVTVQAAAYAEKGEDYVAGYGDIDLFTLADDSEGIHPVRGAYTATMTSVYSIKDQTDYSGFANTLVNYEFRIPRFPEGGGVLSFSAYAWLTNARISTPTVDGVQYVVLTGQRSYSDAMPGGSTDVITVLNGAYGNSSPYDGQRYTLQASTWLSADGEESKKTASIDVTLSATLENKYNLTTTRGNPTSFSGYYNKATNAFYATAAAAAAAGDTGAVFGRFFWIGSYLVLKDNNQPYLEPYSDTVPQTWKLDYSVVATQKTGGVTTTTTETREEYLPYLVDSIDYSYGRPAGTEGFVYDRELSINGGAIPYHNSYSKAAYTGANDAAACSLAVGGVVSYPLAGHIGNVSLVFVANDPEADADMSITRTLNWKVSDLTLTGESGATLSDADAEHPADSIPTDNTGSVVAARKGDGGGVGKSIGFHGVAPSSGGVGNLRGLYSNVTFSSTVADAEINAVNLFTKWDADGLTLNDTTGASFMYSYYAGNYTGTDTQNKVLFAAKADGTNWTDDDEMLQTEASSGLLVFYDSYDALVAAGKVCVGALNEYRGGIVSGTALGAYIVNMRLTGEPDGTYLVCSDYELWSGDNVLTAADSYSGTNGGAKPALAAPSSSFYADYGNGTGFTKDDWSSGAGVIKDANNRKTATSIHELGYTIHYSRSKEAGYWSTVLNGLDGPKDTWSNYNPVTFNVSLDQRTVAVRSRVTIDWQGDEGSDPESLIELGFRHEFTPTNAVWQKIHPVGNVYVADESAVVTWDEATKTFTSDDPSFQTLTEADADGYYHFTVNGGGGYCVYHTYYLGNTEDLSQDVANTQYNLSNRFLCYSPAVCYAANDTNDATYPTVTVIRNGVIGVIKQPLDSVTAPGEDVGYSLSSSSEASAYTGTTLLDVLPFNDDGRGSVIQGGYTLQGGGVTMTMTTASDAVASSLTLYYTADTAVRTAGVNGALPSASQASAFDPANTLGVSWKAMTATLDEANSTASKKLYTLTPQAGDEAAAPTAILLYGNFAKNERYAIRLAFHSVDNAYGNIYANNASMTAPSLGNTDVFCTTSTVRVVSKTVNGTAWIDANGDGVHDEGEAAMSGVRVRLYTADGTEVTQDVYGNAYSVTTGRDGTYEFKNMPDNADGWYVAYELTEAQAEQYSLTGYRAEGADEAVNSDFLAGGAAGTGATAVFTLLSYAEQSANNSPVDATQTSDMGFKPRYTVTWLDGGHGTLDPAAPEERVAYNDKPTQDVTVTPTGDYNFSGQWKVETWDAATGSWVDAGLTTDYKSVPITADTRFTALYYDWAKIEFTGTKTLTGGGKTTADIASNQFGFRVKRTDVNGLAVNGVPNGIVYADAATGNIDFGSWSFSKAGTYTFIISEIDVTAGYTRAEPVYMTVEVTLNAESNVLEKAISFKNPAGDDTTLSFANTYTAPEAIELPIAGAKTLDGGGKTTADIADNQFGFTVTRTDGNGLTVGGLPAGTVYAAAGTGALDFGKWSFEKAGVYIFTIKENEVPAGYTKAEPVTVVVNVSYDGNTNTLLSAVSYTSGDSLLFANKYTYPSPIKVELKGSKTLENGTLRPNQFSFALAADENNPEGAALSATTEVSNEANGSFSFGELTFSKPGVYSFTVSETGEAPAGYTYDGQSVTVTYTVELQTDNTFAVTDTSYTKNGEAAQGVIFTNAYESPTPVKLALTGTKTLTENGNNKAVEAGQFSFHIEAAAGNDATGYTGFAATDTPVEAGGQFRFSDISFTKAGVYSFIIRENNLKAAGYTYDGAVFTATVEVTLNTADNSLVLQPVVYNNGADDAAGISFVNTYATPSAADVRISGTKTLTENGTPKPIKAEQFSFTIAEDSGNNKDGYSALTADNVKVTANGGFDFGTLSFNSAGLYRFSITEDAGNAAGYTYDGKTVELTVTVALDKETNALKATPVYTVDGKPVTELNFANTYAAPEPLVVALKGTKTLSGDRSTADIKAGEFTVTEMTIFGDFVIDVEAGGAIDLGSMTFTMPGTATYTVYENDLGKPGFTYDGTKYLITVTATLNTDTNKLEAKTLIEKIGETANEPADAVVFANTYTEPEPITEPVGGEKTLNNGVMSAEQFSFAITADENNPDGATLSPKTTATNDADGNFSFGELSFSKSGEYSFTVSETGTAPAGYTYDERAVTVTYTVELQADNTLKVTKRSFTKGGEAAEGISFENAYEDPKPVGTVITGTKTLTENNAKKDIEEGQFTVHIEAAEGNDVNGYSGFTAGDKPVAADGSFAFDEISFTKAGDYSFVVKENDLRAAGYTYDRRTVTVTVKVSLNTADNSLQIAAVSYSDGSGAVDALTFANTYETPTPDTVTAGGTKSLLEGELEKAITEGQFSFSIKESLLNDRDGYENFVADSVEVKADGSFAFAPISFVKAGVYKFNIT